MGKKKSLKDRISEKYGGATVYRWSGYADEPKEQPLVTLIEAVAKELSINPSYLYTIAVGEGLGINYVDEDRFSTHYNLVKGKSELRTDLQINGYQVLGLDDFGSEYNRYEPYLPEDFEIGPVHRDTANRWRLSAGDHEFGAFSTMNDRTVPELVTPGIFRNLEASLQGLGATMAHRRSLFNAHRAEFKYTTPTEDQEAYWIYVYYQGEGRARRYLKSNGGLDYNKKAPALMGEIKQLSMERLATWRYMQALKLFSS